MGHQGNPNNLFDEELHNPNPELATLERVMEFFDRDGIDSSFGDKAALQSQPPRPSERRSIEVRPQGSNVVVPSQVVQASLGPVDRLRLHMQRSSCTLTQDSKAKVESDPIENKHGSDRECKMSPSQSVLPSTTNGKRKRSEAKALSSSSKYKGVTRHINTGKWEAHLWDSDVKRPAGHRRKRGRQIYLGQYEKETDAAKIYDLATLSYHKEKIEKALAAVRKTFGGEVDDPISLLQAEPRCLPQLNFPGEVSLKTLEEIFEMDKDEFIARLKKKVTKAAKFSENSKFKGVYKRSASEWEAKINVPSKTTKNKKTEKSLGIFPTEVDAAKAYDVALLKQNNGKGVLNFERHTYEMM